MLIIYLLRCFAQRVLNCWICIVCAGAAAMPIPCAAQVLEIATGGSVYVRDGAGVATWESALGANGNAVMRYLNTGLPEAAVTIIDQPDAPALYARAVEVAAEQANVSPVLLSALVWQESRWRANAVSRAGARGLSQLMPGTARDLGVDANDPSANLGGGARYLRQQLDRFGGNIELALAAYNAGPGRVARAGGVPAIRETQVYVASIMARLASPVRR